jgi:hypothetical protein
VATNLSKLKTLRTNPPTLSGTTRRKGFRALALLVLCFFAGPAARAQEAAVPEEQLKAAFLYNFVRFVEWPETAFAAESTPLTICVSGDDDFTTKLGSLLKDKKAHNRSFVVKKLGAASEAANCHLVFVAKGDSRKTAAIAEAAQGKPVLLVGESDDFLTNGGMINIVQDEKQKQLRFDVAPKPAEKAGLTISSHLLRLARNTKKGAE